MDTIAQSHNSIKVSKANTKREKASKSNPKMKQSISVSEIATDVPMFLYTLDENDYEYIICTGKFPMIIKIKDYEYEYEEGDEDEEEESDTEHDPEKLIGEFHVEVLKITNSGLKPLGYEKETKAVKQIVKRAIDFYLALEDEEQ